MPPNLTLNPCSIYLESTFLLDLSDELRPRHQGAMALLRLFQRHRKTGLIEIITSEWTFSESHHVLYGDQLTQGKTHGPIRGGKEQSPRNVLPPDQTRLSTALTQLERGKGLLQSSVRFLLWPQQEGDSNEVFHLAHRIERETAIWPQDAMHLAIALQSGCSFLITDDGDFLDKIELCQESFIEPYRKERFSQPEVRAMLLPFQGISVGASRCMIPGKENTLRSPAHKLLRVRGYT